VINETAFQKKTPTKSSSLPAAATPVTVTVLPIMMLSAHFVAIHDDTYFKFAAPASY
jgi:hypothetical protein